MALFKSKKKQPSRQPKRSNAKLHSYYAPRQYDKTESIDMTKRSHKLLTSGFVKRLAVVMFMLFVAWTLSISSSEPIVLLSGSQNTVSVDRYARSVQNLLGSSIFNSSKLTLQRAKIENHLMDEFPELASVNIRSDLIGRKPEVELDVMEMPFQVNALGRNYTVAANGRVAGNAEDFRLIKSPLIVRDETGISLAPGELYMRSDDAGFITTLKKIALEKGIALEYARFTTTPREVWLKPKDRIYQIRMSLEDDVYTQFGSWLATEKVVGEQGGSIAEYIDTRAGEKVFIK